MDEFSTASESPSSKSIKVSGDRQTGMIVKRMKFTSDDPNSWETEIPNLGDYHPYRDDLYFFDADIKPVSGGWADLVLNYSWRRSGVVESQLRNQTADFPLSTHPDYLLRWDHNLISRTSEGAEPIWWADAKHVFDIMNEADFNDYKLSQSLNMSADEVLVSGRIKPKNTWSRPKKSVIEKYYCASLSEAQEWSLTSGKLTNPVQDFGLGNAPYNIWFVSSAPITRDMGFWVVTVTYELNEDAFTDNSYDELTGWDTDIYKAVTE
ncbi:MAG: hypothetical protein GY750_20975 [Lentisphaerae bacterium]|nr:hypothetical protein [Lentisphaerota bacterium]